MSRDSFPKASTTRSAAAGDLVHVDLGGPMEVATPRGNRFYIALVDDYSCYSVVHPLQRKSDAEKKIREYCALLKNQFGRYPKCIRTDGGGEFSGASLMNFLAENGILVQRTAPYSPQQNGVVERKNRYLVEMMRCMLSEAELDKRFWGEAICTANYLQNRLPSSSIDTTPYELWCGKKPSYAHLRIFGSEAYVHVPKEKRRKLDMKAEKMVFVGYEGRKAYRFLDLETNYVTISRDAKFLELCTVKEAVHREPVMATGGVVEIPLALPSEEEKQVVGVPDQELESDTEPDDINDSRYDSASEGDRSFHGFPLDEIARRSMRSTKGKPPARLIEECREHS